MSLCIIIKYQQVLFSNTCLINICGALTSTVFFFFLAIFISLSKWAISNTHEHCHKTALSLCVYIFSRCFFVFNMKGFVGAWTSRHIEGSSVL